MENFDKYFSMKDASHLVQYIDNDPIQNILNEFDGPEFYPNDQPQTQESNP